MAGPARSSTPIVQVVLDELPETTLDRRRRRDRRRAVPEPRAARARRRPGTATRRRSTTSPPRRCRRSSPASGREPGSLPTDARPSAQPVHAVRAQPRADRGRADHRPLPGAAVREGRAPGRGDRLHVAAQSDLEIVVAAPAAARRPARRAAARSTASGRGSTTGSVTAPASCAAGDDLKRDVLDAARARRRDGRVPARDRRARPAAARGRRCVFVHSTLPHGPWRYLPDGRRYPIEGNEYPGLASKGWIGPQWQVDQALPAPRAAGRSTSTGCVGRAARQAARARPVRRGRDRGDRRPRRRVRDRRAAAPGERARNVGDDRAGAVLRQAAGPAQGPRRRRRGAHDRRAADDRRGGRRARCRGRPTGCRPASAPVDPAAPIDVSHAGVPVADASRSRAVLAKRRERERVEARLLRDGLYAVGPAARADRPARRVAARASSA